MAVAEGLSSVTGIITRSVGIKWKILRQSCSSEKEIDI